MPRYVREYRGTSWFFSVVTAHRRRIFTDERARLCLREAVAECKNRYPFTIEGWVLLPDHMHCIWSVGDHDSDFSRRWSIIKRLFTRTFRKKNAQTPPYWQNRFWEHCIRDDSDFENHLNYIHFNPVRHGYVASPKDWPWTSFHRYVVEGIYPQDWASCDNMPSNVGNE